MKKILLIPLVLVFFLLTGCSSNNWTLILCEDMHYSGGCNHNASEIDGFSSYEECSTMGRSYLDIYPGYECGRDCRHEGVLLVCEDL